MRDAKTLKFEITKERKWKYGENGKMQKYAIEKMLTRKNAQLNGEMGKSDYDKMYRCQDMRIVRRENANIRKCKGEKY